MKIALFSDIHANLPALDCFFKSLEQQADIDAIYCLGDLVGYQIWPNEVVAAIRKRKIPTLAGNHDLKIFGIAPIAEKDLINSGKHYAYHIIQPEHRNYLQDLPLHIRLHFDQTIALLTHGSPRSINEYMTEDMEDDLILEIMEEAEADILCVGHSHKPFHKTLLDGKKTMKHLINIGSVGKPKDGNPEGCYALLNIDSRLPLPKSVNIEFVRFSYDVEMASEAIEKSPLPNEFADRLRHAY